MMTWVLVYWVLSTPPAVGPSPVLSIATTLAKCEQQLRTVMETANPQVLGIGRDDKGRVCIPIQGTPMPPPR